MGVGEDPDEEDRKRYIQFNFRADNTGGVAADPDGEAAFCFLSDASELVEVTGVNCTETDNGLPTRLEPGQYAEGCGRTTARMTVAGWSWRIRLRPPTSRSRPRSRPPATRRHAVGGRHGQG